MAPPAWRKGGNSLIEAFPSSDAAVEAGSQDDHERPQTSSSGTDATLGGVAAEDRDFVKRRLLELPVRARAS